LARSKSLPAPYSALVRSACGGGTRAPAASAASAQALLISGGCATETLKSRRATIAIPAGRWKFSSNVIEFRAMPQTTSARWSAIRIATVACSRGHAAAAAADRGAAGGARRRREDFGTSARAPIGTAQRRISTLSTRSPCTTRRTTSMPRVTRAKMV
jgi:hypothetical protein